MGVSRPLRFVDVFAGCGGLSAGLVAAGWQGVFAIEKSPMAFETLKYNLLDRGVNRFAWPSWLPQEAMTCEALLQSYPRQLSKLKGQIDLIVGGPPCQGFSTAGKRNPTDPRNKMTEQYLALVALVQPRFIVIENVAGFDMKFEDEEGQALLTANSDSRSYAKYVAGQLKGMGYRVYPGLVNCADFGVPQSRRRFLMICERASKSALEFDLFKALKDSRRAFLASRGLPLSRNVTCREAISDLETKGRLLVPSADSPVRGFQETVYKIPAKPTAFQSLMRRGAEATPPDSRRLARHKPETVVYFSMVQAICRPGYCLSPLLREIVGTRKHSTTVLDPDAPAPTITTLPDDILHYDEPRILTVRENARLQSFPDWYSFRGKYTTGGAFRKLECPRYTQVGNAVPPLLAQAIGEVVRARSKSLHCLASESVTYF